MKTILLLIRHLCLFFLVLTCLSATPSHQTDYSHEVYIGKHIFATEIADTPEKMQRGMMFRDKMADNQAMLFVYPQPQQASFWMKNTFIPLDMLFFDKTGRLLEIKHSIPPCKVDKCPIYNSQAENVQHIIELKGGISQQLALKVGEKLIFVDK